VQAFTKGEGRENKAQSPLKFRIKD